MPVDPTRERLERRLLALRPAMLAAEQAYTNTAPLAYIDREQAKVLGDRVKAIGVNFCRLAVDVLAQRLAVTGFRSSPGDVVDSDLAALWQAVNLDESSQLVMSDALTFGRGYFLAWADGNGRPVVTAESPLQTIVERDPMTGRVVAALKRWTDLDGRLRSLVITPREVVEYASPSPATTDPAVTTATTYVYAPEALQVVRREDNPLGLVPVVPLVNRPRTGHPDGESELADLMPVVAAIGKTVSDMLVASDYAAAPKRWATGLLPSRAFDGARAVNEDQLDELELDIRQKWEKVRPSKFIAATNPETRFGTFDQAELTNFDTAVKLLTGQVAALASLPPYFVSQEATNPTSADAIRSAESRLTLKARQRQRWFSGPMEDLMRLLVTIRDGQPDPRLDDLVTLWSDPEPSTIAQTADAQSKLYGAGIVDRRTSLEALDLDPVSIDRILATPTPNGVA